MSGEQLPPPADAGTGLSEVILKACAYDREDRYQTAEEFREALEAVKDGRRIRLSGRPDREKRRRQKDRNVQDPADLPGADTRPGRGLQEAKRPCAKRKRKLHSIHLWWL